MKLAPGDPVASNELDGSRSRNRSTRDDQGLQAADGESGPDSEIPRRRNGTGLSEATFFADAFDHLANGKLIFPIAIIFKAGHFRHAVLCWRFRLPPMTPISL